MSPRHHVARSRRLSSPLAQRSASHGRSNYRPETVSASTAPTHLSPGRLPPHPACDARPGHHASPAPRSHGAGGIGAALNEYTTVDGWSAAVAARWLRRRSPLAQVPHQARRLSRHATRPPRGSCRRGPLSTSKKKTMSWSVGAHQGPVGVPLGLGNCAAPMAVAHGLAPTALSG